MQVRNARLASYSLIRVRGDCFQVALASASASASASKDLPYSGVIKYTSGRFGFTLYHPSRSCIFFLRSARLCDTFVTVSIAGLSER